ncbi:UDP-N-acetylmuramoyl-L-alanyl-D-glutamate--2,6-diaminopimelate ligase [Planococcus sp. N028]|uniref:UDP-N-acetylmuramyl-tripeptide synthetase n=1 Tax=Planococcus shixiaomingii TaxID=3058393 RepID=A0ABT8MYP7_9BACL|nr:UDP-N-acetylmuramoyl-L-alanyl-D-glutamate--2,6-diaminopimelate ligase [Planococcus sp. N028]MDN7240765.1 UDP-N-acetylmuramoyl-L-alanyl-D-glutamate--2,6-diaminopimelate ligase [Planococcus sp. N028]
MKLKNLISELSIKNNVDKNLLDQTVLGIAENSLLVEPGFLFIAVKGHGRDGHHFIEQAVENGASIIIGELDRIDVPVPYIQVQDSRKAVGRIANKFYHNPSKDKLMIGITGTNGKTTTSYMLKHIFESNGKSCAVIGTIQNIVNGKTIKSTNTTPSSLVAHQLLAASTDDVVIMEVSSHGLVQHRIAGIEFDFCLFTNLHHEHLDYHGTLSNYFQAKALLFQHLKPTGQAIVSTDTVWGLKLADMLKSKGIPTREVGQTTENDSQRVIFNPENSTIELLKEGEAFTVPSSLAGLHNLYNALLAYATAEASGINKNRIADSLADFKGVAGRLELFKMHNGATVIIDYAHTPDAILHVLTTAKQLGAKKVVHIFGFRGNRDISKRKDMLFVSSDLSDQYILTLDDLNSVSCADMLSELTLLNDSYGNEKGLIVPDRTLAIKLAMEYSQSNDYIVITGKGHETYQQPFQLSTPSDQETVNYILNLQVAAKS